MPELLMNYQKKSHQLRAHTFRASLSIHDHYETIARFNGYRLIQRSFTGYNSKDVTIYAVSRNNKVHVRINCTLLPRKGIKVDVVAASPSSQIWAATVYKLLLRRYRYVQSSNCHSRGGMKLWQRIARARNLKFTHHSHKMDGNRILWGTRRKLPLFEQNDWDMNYTTGNPFKYSFFEFRKHGSKSKQKHPTSHRR